MKKIILVVIAVALMLVSIGCGASDNVSSNTTEGKQLTLSESDIDKMYSDPDAYKGYEVNLFLKVFKVEKDAKYTVLQAWKNPDNSTNNTIISIPDPNASVKENDIINVKGTVREKFEGENALGGKVSAPIIDTDSFEVTTYDKAFAKAKFTLNIDNGVKNQHGYVMNVKKVEFADKETRVYLTVTNKSKNKISFYDFNSKIVQNNKQFEVANNFDSDYPKIQDQILPGVTSEGVITFAPVDIKAGKMKLLLEGSSENYMLNFKPFEYNLTWNAN